MTDEPFAQPLSDAERADPWYLPNPPKKPDMQQYHNFHFPGVPHVIRRRFAHRADVLVGCKGYLCYETWLRDDRLVPELLVAFGVDPKAIVERNGYVINGVGKPPEFVIEVASQWTRRADYTYKREGYAHFGVSEYWRFDYTGGRYYDAPLAGDLLVNGEYQPIPLAVTPEGVIWGHSPALGLDLCWERGALRLYDPAGGKYLLSPDELAAERDAAVAERAVLEREIAVMEREIAVIKQEIAVVEQEIAVIKQEIAVIERDTLAAKLDIAVIERDAVRAERDAAIARVRQLEEMLCQRPAE